MPSDIATRRLHTQGLVNRPFASAADAVAWLGAVQAQDYSGAKWALGQRVRGLTEKELDRLYDVGAILRTHVMRPTWHFVLPVDIRWLLELTTPRVKAATATYDRRLEIDQPLLRQSHAAMEAALARGPLTRPELQARLAETGILTDIQRMGHLLMHAELDRVIISGPRRGKKMTYAPFDERVPAGGSPASREEKLAELTRRYFTSHGPAQLQDFSWWSGLTMADGRRGLEIVGGELRQEQIGDKTYWCAAAPTRSSARRLVVHLLPNYDEYLVSYRDRTAALDRAPDFAETPFPLGGLLGNVVTVNGQVHGGWWRRRGAGTVVVEVARLQHLSQAERLGLERAAQSLARFSGVTVTIAGAATGGG